MTTKVIKAFKSAATWIKTKEIMRLCTSSREWDEIGPTKHQFHKRLKEQHAKLPSFRKRET